MSADQGGQSAESDAPVCEGHLEAPRHADCPFLHPHERHTLGRHRVIPPGSGVES